MTHIKDFKVVAIFGETVHLFTKKNLSLVFRPSTTYLLLSGAPMALPITVLNVNDILFIK